MTNSALQFSPTTREKTELSGRALFSGVAVVSFGALVLELGLTRLFSVILFYHFAFLAISIALLGLGSGGVFSYVNRKRLGHHPTRKLGARCSAANAVAIAVLLEIVLHVPVSLALTKANLLRLSVIYLVSAVPFFLTGLLFSAIYARERERIPVIYAADLGGGAVACLALVPLLDILGAPNAILFAAVSMALSSAVWSVERKWRKRSLAMAAVLAALIGLNSLFDIVDVVYAKGIRIASTAKVEFVRWNAISRVEVDLDHDGARWVVIDRDANSALINVAPQAWQGGWESSLMSAAPAVVNIIRPHGDYAIIGPGGGVDVLRAVANGSPDVVGIEINPIIADTIMRHRYADYAYHLYELPNVHIAVSDGRSFIRGTSSRFDVIEMTLVDTWASTAAGAFALSENYLYTVEAFEQYFEHLRADGFVAITRWEFKQPREALRVLAVAMDALHHLGVVNPAKNFIVISDGHLNVDGRPVTVLAKRTPFTPSEERAARRDLSEHSNLVPLYLPSFHPDNPFSQLIARNDPWAFARSYAYNVAPVTDDAPFLFFTLKTGQVLKHAAMLRQGIDWKVNLGVLILVVVLLISLAAVLVFLVVPLLLCASTVRGEALPLAYFVAIGLGYMLVEITFVQRLVLFLGNPTYAITVVIFLLLLSSGVGSWSSGSLLRRFIRVRIVLVAIAITLVAEIALLPRELASMVGLPFLLKLIVSAAVLIPLGFAMGMPFPTGLRALEPRRHEAQPITGHQALSQDNERLNTVEWAWAMNASSSVLGSVLAMVIAVHWGLGMTLACGAAAYLTALAVTPAFKTA